MKSIILIIIFFTIASCSENKTEKHVASKYKCLLDSISFEDTLYIIEEHDGCFDRGIKTIKIFKKNNFLFSIFRIRILDSNYVFNAYLKDTSVLAYKELENKIKENKEEMDECTTTSTISPNNSAFTDPSKFMSLLEKNLPGKYLSLYTPISFRPSVQYCGNAGFCLGYCFVVGAAIHYINIYILFIYSVND